MSKEDLLNLGFTSTESNFYKRLQKGIDQSTIVNIYMVDGELIKIGSGSKIKKEAIIYIDNDIITIQYDSHQTDILINNIKKVEYY